MSGLLKESCPFFPVVFGLNAQAELGFRNIIFTS